MSLTSPETDPGTVNFFAFHQPGLEDGDYELSITQTLTSRDASAPLAEAYKTTASFSVCGERFELPPDLIDAVFPPPGSLGEHSHVFPHVSLSRSTLPWERQVDGDDGGGKSRPPWLALLLFDEDEKIEPKVVTLNDLRLPDPTDPTDGRLRWKWPGLHDPPPPPPPNATPAKPDRRHLVIEKAQHWQDSVTVIDVESDLLRAILPTRAELQMLTHVRHAVPAADSVTAGDETAMVMSSRLPRPGVRSTAHLVSLEGRFMPSGDFDDRGARTGELIRLVSLKSWSFACVFERHSFRLLLNDLLKDPPRGPSTLQLPCPATASDEARKFLALGCVPLPHTGRSGDATFSWYHGPLSPAENNDAFSLPASTADELVRYHPAHGMFDVSYAAAWELGRLLALQNKTFSVALYQWKRRHATQLKRAEQRLLHSHLPNWKLDPDLELPTEVARWFVELSLLQGVPFNYLVPDERMLPPESIRFFWLDDLWVDCLLDGAFSIGRVTSSDHHRDTGRSDASDHPHDLLTGCIIRSEVVAGWPALLVDGFTSDSPKTGETPLAMPRMERLSASVLLCLFEGQARRVEIHQKPEALHFGFKTAAPPDHPNLWKKLRPEPPLPANPSACDLSKNEWRDEARRVLDITKLATAIQGKLPLPTEELNAATFAYQMIEGVEKVVFKISGG